MSKLRKEMEGNGRLCLEKNKMMWKKTTVMKKKLD